MAQGELTQILENERQVLVDNKGYILADHIQIKYIKVGQVSFSVDKVDKQTITFIKNVSAESDKPNKPLLVQPEQFPIKTEKASENKPMGEFKVFDKESYWKNKELKDTEKQIEIRNSFCLREGIKCIELNNALEESENY